MHTKEALQRRKERFFKRLEDPDFVAKMSYTVGPRTACPECGGENGDHDDDCDLDE